jgi:two-component system LytT family response regulator
LRVHQSHLINLKFVRQYLKGKLGMVEMVNGEKLPVSRERKDSLIDSLGKI